MYFLKFLKYINISILVADIQTEKTHQSLFHGVEGFDKSQMRHAETHEKVALPAKEGKIQNC